MIMNVPTKISLKDFETVLWGNTFSPHFLIDTIYEYDYNRNWSRKLNKNKAHYSLKEFFEDPLKFILCKTRYEHCNSTDGKKWYGKKIDLNQSFHLIGCKHKKTNKQNKQKNKQTTYIKWLKPKY